MICYFPFTYISDELIGTLTRALGPLAVYQGLERRVPEHMRQWAAQAQLEVRLPSGVDPERLQHVFKEYENWAELHRGSLHDLSAFMQNASKGAPLVDETDPTQISSQIRSQGQAPAAVDQLFQASLFLVISQEFDIHQEALAKELGAVERMEQQMFSHLDGKAPEPGPAPSSPGEDLGLYMTDARIQAWAQLAGCDNQPCWAFLTSSRAVLEVLVDKLPQARQLMQLDLGEAESGVNDDTKVVARRDFLRELAYSRDPWAIPFPDGLAPTTDTSGQRLTFYCVQGLPPQSALDALRGHTGSTPSNLAETPQPQNTLIGILTPI